MIVYGYKTTAIKSEPLPHEKCPACEHEGAVSMHIFTSYAHVFWIPFFPYRKFGVAHCGNCNKSFEKKEMSDGMKRELFIIKPDVKHPIWSFVGLMLVAVLIIALTISNKNDADNNKTYIENPIVGDIYSVKLDGGYSLMKVVAIDDTIVELLGHKYMINEKYGLDDLLKEDDFVDTFLSTKTSLQEMFADETIFDVQRTQ